MATYWEIAAHSAYWMYTWSLYLIVSLFFPPQFWSGSLFLIAPFPDRCLLVPSFPFYRSVATCKPGSPLNMTLALKWDVKPIITMQLIWTLNVVGSEFPWQRMFKKIWYLVSLISFLAQSPFVIRFVCQTFNVFFVRLPILPFIILQQNNNRIRYIFHLHKAEYNVLRSIFILVFEPVILFTWNLCFHWQKMTKRHQKLIKLAFMVIKLFFSLNSA